MLDREVVLERTDAADRPLVRMVDLLLQRNSPVSLSSAMTESVSSPVRWSR